MFGVHQKSEPLIREFFLPTRQACEAGGNGEGVKKRGGHMLRKVLQKQSSINNHQSNKVTMNGSP
jgi:hypothetical protein